MCGAKEQQDGGAVWIGKERVDRLPGTRLCLGTVKAGMRPEELRQAGVTHVVNAGAFAYDKDDAIAYLDLPVQNTPDSDISRHFPVCNDFIHTAVRAGGGLVLVHCRAGRSRTATLACAYLIAHCQMSVEEALEAVRHARPMSKPIDAFMLQLLDYSRKLPPVTRCEVEHGEGRAETERPRPRSLGQVTFVPKNGERRRGSIFTADMGGVVISSRSGLAFKGVAAWLGHVEAELEAEMCERREEEEAALLGSFSPTALFPRTPPLACSPPPDMRTGLGGLTPREALEVKAHCLLGHGPSAQISA